MIKKSCRQMKAELEKEIQSKYKDYEFLFGKIPAKGINEKIKEVDSLIDHIDNRIHYTETRITRTVTFSVTLIAIGMAFFAAIINLKGFSLYLGLITSGSMILTGLAAVLIHTFQVNPRYPFKALPNDWKWFYPRIVDGEYKPKTFVREKKKSYLKKRLLHINGLSKYAHKIIDETSKERLKIDIQQLYLLHVNEKYKNYFLTTLRKVLNIGVTIVLTSLILLFLNVSVEKIKSQKIETAETTLKTLLGSGNLTEQRAAFEKIVSSPNQYVPLVRDRLELFAKDRIKLPTRSIDRLFYLAALLKDKSIVPPIEALWRNTNILPYYCLYSCPIVFALTIYATYDLWTPPDNMNKVLDRHHDLYPEIRIASNISLDPTPEEHRARGPGIDSLLKEASSKSEEELIEQAGPKTKDWEKRFAAVCQLSYTVATSKNLKNLYWLVIQEVEPDGACEFRSSLYTAIYRAERAKRLGR